jgi:hypothetical protein
MKAKKRSATTSAATAASSSGQGGKRAAVVTAGAGSAGGSADGSSSVIKRLCYGLIVLTVLGVVLLLSPAKYEVVRLFHLGSQSTQTRDQNHRTKEDFNEIQSLESVLFSGALRAAEKPISVAREVPVSARSDMSGGNVRQSSSPPLQKSDSHAGNAASIAESGNIIDGSFPRNVVKHEVVSWKEFTKTPALRRLKRVGDFTSLPLLQCPSETVAALKKPVLSEEDYKWCEWALAAGGVKV